MMPETSQKNRQIADLPGGRTAYLDQGTGQPLVLIHGVGLNASVWAPQIDAFATDHRVIAYDTLGHGASDNPAADARLPDYTFQLGSLLDELGVERVVLMGHSMGALVATLFALEQPDRVQCLVAANPVYHRPAAQLSASRARLRRIEAGGPADGLDELLARWFGKPVSREASLVEPVKSWITSADPGGYAAAYRVFSEADPWLAGRLGELQAPGLFVTGALDPNSTPAMARRMADEAPRGEARVLDGERHMMAYASPTRFNATVRAFLDRHAGPRELPATGDAARRV